MSILTKKYLPTADVFARARGSLALPLLDGMWPAYAAGGRRRPRPVKRFGAVYVPNGVEMRMWTPKAEGNGFGFSPISGAARTVPGPDVRPERAGGQGGGAAPGEGIGDHARAASSG